jgi:phasin family protein
MTAHHKGPQRRTPRKAPVKVPTPHVPAMTAAEAAPPIEAAHDAASIAAAPLVPAEALAPEPVTPAIPSPNPEPVADGQPALADIAATPAEPTEDSSMTIDATIQNAAETATDKGQAIFADVSERTKAAAEKSQKLLAEVAEFNKGTLEAFVESSKIAARGFEAMGQDAAAYAKTSFEGASQAVKTLATVKSPTEFLRLQAEFTRSAFDALVAHTSRSTEASLKLAGEVAQPISNRVALMVDKVKIAA